MGHAGLCLYDEQHIFATSFWPIWIAGVVRLWSTMVYYAVDRDQVVGYPSVKVHIGGLVDDTCFPNAAS
jgi:hypothetical protein